MKYVGTFSAGTGQVAAASPADSLLPRGWDDEVEEEIKSIVTFSRSTPLKKNSEAQPLPTPWQEVSKIAESWNSQEKCSISLWCHITRLNSF